MKNQPEVIDLSSDSSANSGAQFNPDTSWLSYFPPNVQPPRLTRERDQKHRHDVHPPFSPPPPESSEVSSPWIPVQPPPQPWISPFLPSDDEESVVDPPSSSKPSVSDPSQYSQLRSSTRIRGGKAKVADVKGKGKGKME